MSDRNVNVEKLKQFFKARNRDLFSADTICSILDLFPDGEAEKGSEYEEIKNRIQQEDNMNRVFYLDEKGPGGGYHRYLVKNARTGYLLADIVFQKGPRKDPKSVQGVLDTDLLEIVRHRLTAFWEGDMSTILTKDALYCVESALEVLNARTMGRKKRGVLGTMEK